MIRRSHRRLLAVSALIAAGIALTFPAGGEETADVSLSIADYEDRIDDGDREHWAFQPVHRPDVPQVGDTAWVRNPIDAFVLAKLEAKGWEPAPRAEPLELLRRVYLDVIGLPPTLAEQDAYLDDPSPESFARTIDALLGRPGYGERWARHWLDLVRYAETNGYERDGTKPHVWRYRDYVIRAFNDDKPFDRFVLEQLAGDELDEVTGETLIATGYYRLGPWDDEPADPATDRYDQLDDIISTTSQVFLGLTMGCARCHDHKFEPLTALDYYRMMAVFDPLKRPQNGRTELDLPAASPAEIARVEQRDREIADLASQIADVRREFQDALINAADGRFFPEAATAFFTDEQHRTDDQKKLVAAQAQPLKETFEAVLTDEARERMAGLTAKIERLRREIPDLPRGYFLHEPSPEPPVSHVLLRGKPGQFGPEVGPGMPLVLAKSQPGFLSPDDKTTRRRLTLARWIASEENPLTARVIVNRVWQYHFGRGLVTSPSDFGVMGMPPSHPELLDWLAAWFVEHDWSLKQLHRLILTSNTYQMSKRSREDYLAADPENELLWRFPYRRLEVEAIRDSVLAASGRLNRKMYGPSMYPFVPKQAMEGHSDPDKIWQPFDEEEASRRTIYAFLKRSLIVPMLEVLDLCDTTRTAAKRQITSVAPQALTLYNGDFINRQSRHFADRLEREAGDDPRAQITLAFRLTLCRPPTEPEIAAMSAYLDDQAGEFADEKPAEARHAALVQLCRVIFNLNEFAYTD